MTELLFQIVTYAPAPIWALMIFAPLWRGTRWVVIQPYFLLPLVALYTTLVLPGLAKVLPILMQPKLAEISALLAEPEGTLIGWIHFIALDLFVGRWIYLDSRERGTSVWVASPILFLTLLFGPIGLLAYICVRLGTKPVEKSTP